MKTHVVLLIIMAQSFVVGEGYSPKMADTEGSLVCCGGSRSADAASRRRGPSFQKLRVLGSVEEGEGERATIDLVRGRGAKILMRVSGDVWRDRRIACGASAEGLLRIRGGKRQRGLDQEQSSMVDTVSPRRERRSARDSSTTVRTESELEELPQSGVEDMEGSGSLSQPSSELKARVDDNLKHLLKETSEEPADSEDIQSMLSHKGLKNISALENFVAQAQIDQDKLNELEAEYAKLEEAEKQQIQRPQKSKLYFRESDSTTEMFDKAERLHDMILAGEPGGGENVSDFSISESTSSYEKDGVRVHAYDRSMHKLSKIQKLIDYLIGLQEKVEPDTEDFHPKIPQLKELKSFLQEAMTKDISFLHDPPTDALDMLKKKPQHPQEEQQLSEVDHLRISHKYVKKHPLDILLMSTAKLGRVKMLKRLVELGADVKAHNPLMGNWTALHSAAAEGHDRAVTFLLEAGADPNFKEACRGFTALHCAACFGFVDTVEALAANGANVNERCSSGWTPLDYSYFLHFSEVAGVGIDEGGDEEEEDEEQVERKKQFLAMFDQLDVTPHQNDTELRLFAKKIIELSREKSNPTIIMSHMETARILGSVYNAKSTIDLTLFDMKNTIRKKKGDDEEEEAKAAIRKALGEEEDERQQEIKRMKLEELGKAALTSLDEIMGDPILSSSSSMQE